MSIKIKQYKSFYRHFVKVKNVYIKDTQLSNLLQNSKYQETRNKWETRKNKHCFCLKTLKNTLNVK